MRKYLFGDKYYHFAEIRIVNGVPYGKCNKVTGFKHNGTPCEYPMYDCIGKWAWLDKNGFQFERANRVSAMLICK